MAAPCLESAIVRLSARRLRQLGHIYLFYSKGKKPNIYCYESYNQSKLKLQAKTLVLIDANLFHDRFLMLFLALHRLPLKDRFFNFYKSMPIFSILPSYQNLLDIDNNSD